MTVSQIRWMAGNNNHRLARSFIENSLMNTKAPLDHLESPGVFGLLTTLALL